MPLGMHAAPPLGEAAPSEREQRERQLRGQHGGHHGGHHGHGHAMHMHMHGARGRALLHGDCLLKSLHGYTWCLFTPQFTLRQLLLPCSATKNNCESVSSPPTIWQPRPPPPAYATPACVPAIRRVTPDVPAAPCLPPPH